MKIYKVGGAVRDEILGLKAHDNDYVVVGSSKEEMTAMGFISVGKSFPVFLHPDTKEEYALARKEIKIGDKHTDFEFVFSPDISLKEDLERRDLTCNAIAFDKESGEYIDPFGGIKDIQNKILRCVNETHFIEDPLRVLRVCRFSAQLDFDVEPKTLELCKKMVEEGAMENLPSERIWEEVLKALKAEKSSKFFMLMRKIGALKQIMPEVDVLFEVPEKTKYHPEGTTGGHVMSALDVIKSKNALIKFGVLTHDLGKALTPKNELPSHHGHANRAKEPILSLCKRLNVPNIYKDFALQSAKFHMHYFMIFEMRAAKIYELVCAMTIAHRSYLKEYIEVCRADFLGSACENRQKESEMFELKAKLLEISEKTTRNIKANDVPEFENLQKDERFGKILRDYKIEVLNQKIKEFKKDESLL